MKEMYYNQKNVEEAKIFKNAKRDLGTIICRNIDEFILIGFYNFDVVATDKEKAMQSHMHILVPTKSKVADKEEYMDILYTQYQDHKLHYEVSIEYKFMTKQAIEELLSD